MSAKIPGGRVEADGGSSRGGWKMEDEDTLLGIVADPFAKVGLLSLV
jgi:hypothetical protein